MAVVAQMPNATFVTPVDPRDLVSDWNAPPVDPETRAPSVLRSLVVSQDPRISVIPHFLTDDEAQHLVDLAEGHWARSLVGRAEKGKLKEALEGRAARVEGQTRTSKSCMLRFAQTATVQRIEKRLASLANLPTSRLERLSMVRYAPGEFFSQHHDGGFRPRTVFIYLNELPEGDGGETLFPRLGLKFVPRARCAVMWSNAFENGDIDSRMVHQGSPPLTTVKYGVNCFFNDQDHRILRQPEVRLSAEEVPVRDLQDLAASQGKTAGLASTSFVLCQSPKLAAVPWFASQDEVTSLLELTATDSGDPPSEQENVAALTIFEYGETPLIEDLEARIGRCVGLPFDHLGRLQVSRGGTTLGSCNRGCGQHTGILCLSEEDEVFFPGLGVRLFLRRGDFVSWSNVVREDGKLVEDLRAELIHRTPVGTPLILEAFFFDTSVRPVTA